MKHQFYKFSDEAAKCDKLHHASFRVAFCLARRADEDGFAWPSLKTIEEDSNVCIRAIPKCLRNLVDLGFVSILPICAGEEFPNGKKARRNRQIYRLTLPGGSTEQSSTEQGTVTPGNSVPSHRGTQCTSFDNGKNQLNEPLEREKPPHHSSRRSCSFPTDWKPAPAHLELAKEHNVDISVEAEKFRDHALAQGRMCKDWNAAFRNWIRKSSEFRQSVNLSHAAAVPIEYGLE